jgi:hypothetical protein
LTDGCEVGVLPPGCVDAGAVVADCPMLIAPINSTISEQRHPQTFIE